MEKKASNSLADFYAQRFNSDPYALMSYCEAEIAAIAADVGIEWSTISTAVQLNGSKVGGKIGVTEKKHKGKVMAWGDLVQHRAGFDLPKLTFNNNHAAYDAVQWYGSEALYSLYKAEGPTRRDSRADAEHQAWLDRQKAQAEQRAAKHAAIERAEREKQARVDAEKAAYELAWHRGGEHHFERESNGRIVRTSVEALGAETGTAPYLIDKGIAAIASVVSLQRMRDQGGEFTAVPLYDVFGEFRGVQRLYADKKLQGAGVNMRGAHFVIGDLATAKRRYLVEGFATGASIYLAEAEGGDDVAVIVAFNAGNLHHVARDFARHHDEWRLINGVDNDRWKHAGNAGVLAALELHREYAHWGVLPNFDHLIAEGFVTTEAVYGRAHDQKGPTDWNDYHALAGLDETRRALRARDSALRAEPDWFGYCLQRIPHAGTAAEKIALQAVNAGMMLVPIKYNRREVLEAVLEKLDDDAPVNRWKLRRRAQWIAKCKMEEARQLRAFSPDALSRVNHMRLTGETGKHGETLLPAHLADFVESLDGFVIVRAPMGSGKTQRLMAPAMKDAPKAAYIAHRISLIGDAAFRLDQVRDSQGEPLFDRQGREKLDGIVRHYQHVCAAEMPYVSHLACCVNSLTNPKFYNADGLSWFSTVDTLLIDEASQVIRHTATGPVESPVRVVDALTDAMAACKRVILCDADANDAVIELCEMADPDKPITVIEVDGPCSHISVTHSDDESVWQMALNEVTAGRRTLIASDSAESAKKMAVAIEESRPSARVLLVHKDSKANPQVEAFLDRPNAEALKYDVLIYSPAISSGVSMTTPHFERHFGIFSGNTVGPSDAVQMLRRDRTATHYVIGIGHTNRQSPTDREALFRGLVAADVIACEYEETADEIVLRRHKTIFDELYLSCRVTENRARNNWANALLLILYADGYKVSHMATDASMVMASREARSAAGKVVFKRRLTLLKEVETPDEETYARLSRQEIRSEAEQAQVDRYNILTQLGVDTVAEDHVKFYDDRGIAKITRLELLQATEQQAREYDRVQRNARVVLTKHRFKTPAWRFLTRTFEALGLDRFTGEGEFTVAQCREVVNAIRESRESLELYNALGLGRYIDPKAKRTCATTVVKSILEKLGVAVHKRRSNGQNRYLISVDDWAVVSGYVEARRERGVHSLETHEAQTWHEAKLATTSQPSDTSNEPSNGAASSYSDTLQNGEDTTNVKYHCLDLASRERLFARVVALKPLGVSASRLVERMDPAAAHGLLVADEFTARWTIEYCSRLLLRRNAVALPDAKAV
ncbi:MAG: plasmid replication protein, CyRepA1 family [Pseudomonadota bacterium]|nr:plasmid replication protein, CyRepA1 family [Pseudomonadota bacterium]